MISYALFSPGISARLDAGMPFLRGFIEDFS